MADNKFVFRRDEDASSKHTARKNVFRADGGSVELDSAARVRQNASRDLLQRVSALLSSVPAEPDVARQPFEQDAVSSALPSLTGMASGQEVSHTAGIAPAGSGEGLFPAKQGVASSSPALYVDPPAAFGASKALRTDADPLGETNPFRALYQPAPPALSGTSDMDVPMSFESEKHQSALTQRIEEIQRSLAPPAIEPEHPAQATETPDSANTADTADNSFWGAPDGGHPFSIPAPAPLPAKIENEDDLYVSDDPGTAWKNIYLPAVEQPSTGKALDPALFRDNLSSVSDGSGVGSLSAETFSSEIRPNDPPVPENSHNFSPREDDFSSANPPRSASFSPVRRPNKTVTFLLIALLILLLIPLSLFAVGFRIVRIYEDNTFIKALFSRERSPSELAAHADIVFTDTDGATVQENGLFWDVYIQQSIPVTIAADGKISSHLVTADTVQDALASAGFTLDPADEVDPPLSSPISPDTHISIYRVVYADRVEQAALPWQEIERNSPLVPEEQRVVMNAGEGRDGEGVVTYSDRYVDGLYTGSEISAIDYIDFPHHVITLVGDSQAVMSPIDASLYTDVRIVNNAPEQYLSVIQDGVCTAYSFDPGVYGASGMYLFQGFVAVNPDVIPYGSLLYITSADGSFVYGWAIAADVGVAMVDGIVDIDCFFETYRESTLFGKHVMNIYIVKQLTQQDLEEFIAVESMFYARIPA